MRVFLVSLLMAGMISGCASTGNGPGSTAVPRATAADQITYLPASDAYLSVTPESISLQGDQGFVPLDPSWLQIKLHIVNKSSVPVRLVSVRMRTYDGTMLAPAETALMTAKPYNFARDAVQYTAANAAGVGLSFLIPGGMFVAPLVAMAPAMVDQQRRARLNDPGGRDLKMDIIPGGTRAVGNVYLPAVREQSGLFVIYLVDGRERILELRRSGPTTPVSVSATSPTTTAEATAVCTARACNIRTGPSTASSVLTSVPRGSSLLATTDPVPAGWLGVRLPDGRSGYVSKSIITTAGE